MQTRRVFTIAALREIIVGSHTRAIIYIPLWIAQDTVTTSSYLAFIAFLSAVIQRPYGFHENKTGSAVEVHSLRAQYIFSKYYLQTPAASQLLPSIQTAP